MGKLEAGDFKWQGPQQAGQPWDNWKPEEHDAARRLIERLERAKTYQSSARMGAHDGAPLFNQIAAQGGIDPEEALTLARYRMANLGLGPVPQGPKTEAATLEERSKRAADFRAGSSEQKARMMHEEDAREYQSHDRFFDSLTAKKKAPGPEKPTQGEGITPEKVQAAREVLAKRKVRHG